MTFIKSIGKCFSFLDMFGEDISVYYRGKKKYQTKIGASCSILVVILLSYVGFFKLEQVFKHEDPTIQQYYRKLNMTESQSIEQQQFGVRVAFQVCDLVTALCQYQNPPEGFFLVQAQIYDSKKGFRLLQNHTLCRSPSSVQLTLNQKNVLDNSVCVNMSQMILTGNPYAGLDGTGVKISLSLSCMKSVNKCQTDQFIQNLNQNGKNGQFIISTQELILDFEDKFEPQQYNEVIIGSFTLETMINLTQPISLKSILVQNEARINENIWLSPFAPNSGQVITRFLTSEPVLDGPIYPFTEGSSINFYLALHDKQLVSIRKVYSVFDVISDMGGISGLFIPLVQIFLQLLQTPRLYLVSLMKHMKPVLRKKLIIRESTLFEKLQSDLQFKLQNDDLVLLIRLLKNYVKFQTSVLIRLFGCYLPQFCQSPKTKNSIMLIEKFKKRMEKSLDVRQIVENDADLNLLLRHLLGSQRYLLFKLQRRRHLSLDEDEEVRESVGHKIKAMRKLKDWVVKSDIDRQLIKGIFMN